MAPLTLPLLIFDGDCGFCTTVATAAEPVLARGHQDPTVVASQFVDLASLGIRPERARTEVLWVGRDGHVSGGVDAIADWLSWHTSIYRPLGLILRWPVIRPLAGAVYRWVARNRQLFPGSTAACAMPPAQNH